MLMLIFTSARQTAASRADHVTHAGIHQRDHCQLASVPGSLADHCCHQSSRQVCGRIPACLCLCCCWGRALCRQHVQHSHGVPLPYHIPCICKSLTCESHACMHRSLMTILPELQCLVWLDRHASTTGVQDKWCSVCRLSKPKNTCTLCVHAARCKVPTSARYTQDKCCMLQGIVIGADVTWATFFSANLLPVVLGNITGGSICVALVMCACYGRLSGTPVK